MIESSLLRTTALHTEKVGLTELAQIILEEEVTSQLLILT